MTRIRLSLAALVAALATIALPGRAAAQGPTSPTAPAGRVAFVAVQAVLQRTPGYAEADSIWSQEAETYRRQLTQLQGRMDSATAAFDQQSVMLSASQRAAEQKKLQQHAADLQQQVTDLQQKATDRQRELLDPIEQRVMAVIEGLRAEGNYSVVFDVSAQNSAIVAADKTLDLTQKAIARLGSTAGSSGGGTPGND